MRTIDKADSPVAPMCPVLGGVHLSYSKVGDWNWKFFTPKAITITRSFISI